MELLDQLRGLGYEVTLDDGEITCFWRAPGLPDRDEVLPLLTALRQQKAEAVVALQEEQAPDHLDPFDVRNHLPPGVVVCHEDRDRPGWYYAKRVGSNGPVGHGEDQVEAILDLDRKEKYGDMGLHANKST